MSNSVHAMSFNQATINVREHTQALSACSALYLARTHVIKIYIIRTLQTASRNKNKQIILRQSDSGSVFFPNKSETGRDHLCVRMLISQSFAEDAQRLFKALDGLVEMALVLVPVKCKMHAQRVHPTQKNRANE
jgi:hypothetical protein